MEQEPDETDLYIKHGLDIAVTLGHMTIKQAEEYWEAYVEMRDRSTETAG